MGLRAAVKHGFCALDLRFDNKDDEASFKSSLASQTARGLSVAMFLLGLLVSISFVLAYPTERQRRDNPFAWKLDDPRTLYFVMLVYNLTIAVLVGTVFFFQLRVKGFSALSAELVAVFAGVSLLLSLFYFSAWHVAVLYNAPPQEVWAHDTLDCEFNKALETIVIVAGASLYVPIRSCLLWILPTCAICNFIFVVTVIGSPFPQNLLRITPQMAFVCFFAMQGAYRHEQSLRERWLAEVQVKSQKLELETSIAVTRALQGVAGINLDVVLQLARDLTVCKSEQTHAAYFGQPLEGLCITDIVAERDRDHLRQLMEDANSLQVVQSMPATLLLAMGPVAAQVVVVGTGCLHPQYLIGVRMEGGFENDGSTSVPLQHPAEEPEQEDMSLSSDCEADSQGPQGWQGERIFVEFNALSSDLSIIQASEGWRAFSGAGASSGTSTGLAHQLDERLFLDFRDFVHRLVRKALDGDWDPQHASHAYRKVDGEDPDGNTYRSVMTVTLPDPAEAVAGAFGFYPVVLSLEHPRPRSGRRLPAAQSLPVVVEHV